MKVRDLLSLWEQTASGALTEDEYRVRLPVEDAAKLRALAELYPRRHVEELISDLLSSALSELESVMPYIRGSKIVATDELGDPLYEDVGPTPKYLSLTEKHLASFRSKDQH
ncbi:type 1 pili tip component [Spongiibacter sp.]|uniref:type 1 pili tip component n=1 Tax=Spongiibacter sp. TaxID=2024860 RepID=UPI00356714A8